MAVCPSCGVIEGVTFDPSNHWPTCDRRIDAQRAAAIEKIMTAFDLSPEERELVEEMAASAQRTRDLLDKERQLFLGEMFAHADALCERLSTELSDVMGVPIKVTYER